MNIEKIPVGFSMDAAGVLTMTTADGSTFTADIGALIKTYEFEDSGTVEFQVRTDENSAKHIKADIIEGSIDGSKLTPDYLAQLTRQAEAAAANATAAAGSATTATQNKEAAEAWAAGTIDGQPVPESNPAYHNNAKYWSEQAPKTTFAGLNDVDVSGVTNGQVPVYNADSGKWEPGAGGGGGGTAESVTYDNTETHLEADNVQEAIDAVFTSVSNGKAIIAEAITDKGIETSAADTFATMAENISEIETGTDVSDTTATAGDVLKDKQFYNSDGELVKGNIEEYPVVEIEVTNKYHMTQKIEGYVGQIGYKLATEESEKIIPENIKKGVTILGVEGEVEEGGKAAAGMRMRNSTMSVTIDCGFKPKYICVTAGENYTGTPGATLVYDETRSKTQQFMNSSTVTAFPTTAANRLGELTDTGFTITRTTGSALACTWFAVG